jgi:hypothetical protein
MDNLNMDTAKALELDQIDGTEQTMDCAIGSL